MQYLCVKQLVLGGTTYNPGDIIPDGVVISQISSSLLRNGYILKDDHEISQGKQLTAELKEIKAGVYKDTVQIAVKAESDGENEQITVIPATPEEIQQVFSIMQINVDEGVKAIT